MVCVDEASKELHATPHGTLKAQPTQPARQDYQYERQGTANIFLGVEPLAGKRVTQITDRRTAVDFALFARFLAHEVYPHAEKIILVTDNLNTHKIASFYEAFAPEEARSLVERFEWHYTPEHGSWLNMAEIEFSVLQKQALKRRLTRTQVQDVVAQWCHKRNAQISKINWHFTTQDARIKLKCLYPNLTTPTV